MDAASVLEQQTQSMSNLPVELKYLLQRMRDKDMQVYEIRRKIQQRDAQLQKYVKQNGSLVKHPREQQVYNKINQEYEEAQKLQKEKCLIANTALYLLTKHLASLEKDAERLESSGEPKILGVDPELSPVDPDSVSSLTSNLMDASLEGSPTPSYSRRSRTRGSRSMSRSRSQSSERRSVSAGSISSLLRAGGKSEEPLGPVTPKPEAGLTRLSGRKKLERGASGTVTIPKSISGRNNEDDELYCFCRQVSYGNMIACDNQNCRFEWFHYGCVGLTEPPKGIWYCPDCRRQMELEQNRKRDRKRK
ncbi:DEKNAAC101170 [Brettanomyces naardenensis]|uniref:Chromatin modification-related protein n=1 Tax=Brettanomyces naardenensis TaxID=13370 RepID=A0A448YHG3_BRENA|nr:DEKNAAC101170 [Brettanomyces naardenensis]